MWNKKLIESKIENPKNALKAYGEFNKISKKSNFTLYFNVNTLTLKLKDLVINSKSSKSSLNGHFMNRDSLESLFCDMIKVSLYNVENLMQSERDERFNLIERGYLTPEFERNESKSLDDLKEDIGDYISNKIKAEIDTTNLDILGKTECWIFKDLSLEEKEEVIALHRSLQENKEMVVDVIIGFYTKTLNIWLERTLEDFKFKDDAVYLLDFSADIDDVLESKNLYNIKKYILKSRSMNVNGERIEFKPEIKDNSAPDVFINNSYYGKITHYVGKNTFLCNSYEEAEALGKKKMRLLKELIVKAKEVHF